MPKIRFLETRTLRDGKGTTFEAGKVYELSEPSCERWIRRKAAEYVQSEKVKLSKPILAEETVPTAVHKIKKIEGPEIPIRDPDRSRILERTSGE
jgi:hypothetical protein